MKKLRLSRYTPGAANEAKTWIENTLGEKLAPGDLIDALKDGTALCKLANLALPPPGIKFKKSPMPFIQMENISHFLRACELPPLGLPSHDRFLTVDLYESKDPAQVLQCLSAFSRVANSVSPGNFPTTLGPKKGGVVSPQSTGPAIPNGGMGAGFGKGRGAAQSATTTASTTFNPIARERALSPTLTGGSNSSKTTDGGTKSPGAYSSWSKKTDEGMTAPAWNIHQYGYMGGANQGSQGIAFGARRQITTAAPHVPSLAEKERKRREQEAEAERARQQAEEAERRMRAEREAEEERERLEEERRWAEQTRRQREEEKRQVETQKREWEEQERKWKAEEERRLREEQEALDRAEMESQRKRATSDARLRGQYLSEYQQEQAPTTRSTSRPRSRRNSTDDRVRELERQLEEAKARENEYEREREERRRDDERRATRRARSRSRPRPPQPQPQRPPSPKESELSWTGDEREYLRQQWADNQAKAAPKDIPSRPLPDPKAAAPAAPLPPKSPRPLPDPATYRPPPQMQQAPQVQQAPQTYKPPKPAPQSKMGWSSKSTLLEKEMELERQRQQEWQDAQERTQGLRPDRSEGSGAGKTWDVNQYGYTGGDNQSRGATGIGFGARRQIIGPRPPPS
jgi:transgelin